MSTIEVVFGGPTYRSSINDQLTRSRHFSTNLSNGNFWREPTTADLGLCNTIRQT